MKPPIDKNAKAMIDDFDSNPPDENSDDLELLKRYRAYLHKKGDIMAYRECAQYPDDLKEYFRVVEENQLQFFHRLKFHQKQRINANEIEILAIQKGISRTKAKAIARDFNSKLKSVHDSEAHQAKLYLTRLPLYSN